MFRAFWTLPNGAMSRLQTTSPESNVSCPRGALVRKRGRVPHASALRVGVVPWRRNQSGRWAKFKCNKVKSPTRKRGVWGTQNHLQCGVRAGGPSRLGLAKTAGETPAPPKFASDDFPSRNEGCDLFRLEYYWTGSQ